MTTTRHPANIDVSPSVPGYSPGALVGGDTAMDASDGDTSYAGVDWNGGVGDAAVRTGHTFTWEPAGASPPPGTVVTIEADWWTPDDGGFFVGFIHPVLGGRTVATFAPEPGESTHDYGSPQTATIAQTWVDGGVALSPGIQWEMWSVASDFGISVGTTARITRLTLVIPGGEVPHLRQRNRDTIRARNLPSRQRGIRARGYL